MLFVQYFHHQFRQRYRSRHFTVQFAMRLVTFTHFRMQIIAFTMAPLHFFAIRRQPTRATHFIMIVRQYRVIAIATAGPYMLFRRPFLRVRTRLTKFVIRLVFHRFKCEMFTRFKNNVRGFMRHFTARFQFLHRRLFQPCFFDFRTTKRLSWLPRVQFHFT